MAANLVKTRKGFTLVELLVVVAVSSVIIATAVAIFTAMLAQRRRAEQTLEVHAGLSMANGLLNFDVANAGYRFPASAFSVRTVQNASGGTTLNLNGLSGVGGTITTTANCSAGSWGLVQGTDVLEVAEGYEDEAPGVVQSHIGHTSFILRGNSNPLTAYAGQPVVLFAGPTGDACLARVTSPTVTPGSTVNITMLRPDYSDEATPSTRYPNCPADGMNVYRLGKRTRYLVCRDPADPANRGVLFRQVSDGSGDFTTGGFQRVQDGVADLQVALRLRDFSTAQSLTGTDCTASPNKLCYCDLSSACGGTDENGQAVNFNPTITDSKSHLQWIKGVVVGVTGVSPRPAVVGSLSAATEYRRPALLDHAAAAGAGDGNLYMATRQSVALQNLVMVTP